MRTKNQSPVCLLFACGTNGAFGVDGKLPWHIPEDLKHYKHQTLGNAVVMGRKTYESLPASAFKGRVSFVLTNQDIPDEEHRDVFFVKTIREAFISADLHPFVERIFVIGGQSVIEQAQEFASGAMVTRVAYDGPFDVGAPVLNSNWQLANTRSGLECINCKHHYQFEYWINPYYQPYQVEV